MKFLLDENVDEDVIVRVRAVAKEIEERWQRRIGYAMMSGFGGVIVPIFFCQIQFGYSSEVIKEVAWGFSCAG